MREVAAISPKPTKSARQLEAALKGAPVWERQSGGEGGTFANRFVTF